MPPACRSPAFRLAAAGIDASAPSSSTSSTPENRQRRVSSLNVSSSSSPEIAVEETDLFLPKRDDGGSFVALFARRKRTFCSSATPSKDHRLRRTQRQILERGTARSSCASFLLATALACLASLSAVVALAAVADASAAALYARAAASRRISPDAAFWDRWEASLLRKAAGGPLTLSLERHWLSARAELTARRWKTAVAVAVGSFHRNRDGGDRKLLAFPPSLPEFLESTCSDLRGDYAPLIAADLRPWPKITREQVESDPDRLYFVRDPEVGDQPRAFLPREASRGRLMPTYHAFLERLSLRASLPDVVIPLNVADEPRAPWVDGRVWGGESAGEDAEAALLRGEAVARKEEEGGGGDAPEEGAEDGGWFSRLKRRKEGAAPSATNDGVDGDKSDEPTPGRRTAENPPDPLFSFCKTDDYADILIPNTIEGDVFVRPRDGKKKEEKTRSTADGESARGSFLARALSLLPRITSTTTVTTHRKTRAGTREDTRPPTAVWRGSTGGFGGLAKGRAALLRLGQERPDVIDSGVYDWDESKWGPAEGRVKERMGLADQVEGHRYLVWAPGNCASVRLALQLASDAVVLKIDSSGEREWYYPLLKPYVHYVPIEANETHVGVEEGIRWAEARPREARGIVLAANAFAERYLSARGRYCYAAQLLSEFRARFDDGEKFVALPEGASAVSGVADRPDLEEPE